MKIKRARKVFVFWAAKRSGHHAIADWVRFQFPFSSVFFNDVTPKAGGDVFQNCTRYWINENVLSGKNPSYDQNFQNVVSFNYESRTLESHTNAMIVSAIDSIVESCEEEALVVLVLRDPFNCLASMLRTNWTGLIRKFPELWKNHASEFLGRTEFLKNKLPICYNRWFSDLEYRRSLFERIKGETFIPMYEKVSGHGGGSSFDGMRFQNAATQMKVFDRWRSVQTHPVFQQLLADPEIASLCRELEPSEFLAEVYSDNAAKPGFVG